MIPSAAGLAKHHSELSLPVAIMAGVGDKIVDCDSQASRLGAELPESTLTKLPGAGHMIHHIVPEQVAGVICDLVRKAAVVRQPIAAAALGIKPGAAAE
jgi:pimeloyl-ACP methyl ester carboxylesterase